jgi:hypothetical protein
MILLYVAARLDPHLLRRTASGARQIGTLDHRKAGCPMAATIAVTQGHDSGRVKRTTRLGSRAAEAHANTWQTFASVYTEADGSVRVSIRRGERSLSISLGAEAEPLKVRDMLATVGVFDVFDGSIPLYALNERTRGYSGIRHGDDSPALLLPARSSER